VGKRGPIESLESGDHNGALGFTGDLAVVEKSLARVDSAVRELVLILMQDRYTHSMERTICSRINLDALDGTPR